jgi:hypothetical protein
VEALFFFSRGGPTTGARDACDLSCETKGCKTVHSRFLQEAWQKILDK